jgi:hypothetical protein
MSEIKEAAPEWTFLADTARDQAEIDRLRAELAAKRHAVLSFKNKLDSLLDGVIREMKSDYSYSIVGFKEAYDIATLRAELAAARQGVVERDEAMSVSRQANADLAAELAAARQDMERVAVAQRLEAAARVRTRK